MNIEQNLPKHVAIIPDGNRRWARIHKIDAWLGHKTGAENFKKILEIAIKLKISHLSFWGSSQDNLTKRPEEEVKFLLNLFKEKFLKLSADENIHKNDVKINIFGKWREQFPEDVKASMEKAILETENYKSYYLNFFIAYSGTGEILDAIKSALKKADSGESTEISRKFLKSMLYTRDLPPVDLMIRTGGEPHLSDGFMMWETANAQLYFSEKLWPNFTKEDFQDAIKDYLARERRFGK